MTYLIQGDIEHGDSIGNAGSIIDGCCQWMTAGSGIIHQEMPKACPRMLGLQLWVNLPAKDKMARPRYRDLKTAAIPKIEEAAGSVAVVAGRYGAVEGATQDDYVKITVRVPGEAPGVIVGVPGVERVQHQEGVEIRDRARPQHAHEPDAGPVPLLIVCHNFHDFPDYSHGSFLL